MGLSKGDITELTAIASESLDFADEAWSSASQKLTLREKAMQTPFPGVPFIDTVPEVRTYFVLMADMRSSTEHLRDRPPAASSVESGLQRLYLETSGLLPTLAHLIRKRNGRVTEYLGDAVLAFIELSDATNSAEYAAAVTLGEDCLSTCDEVVSTLLDARYSLPAIAIGVGMSLGEAVVTTMGLQEDRRPIAFGSPVYDVSQLCKEKDLLLISPAMRERWPKGSGGKRRFERYMARHRVLGYQTWKEG